MSEEQTQEERLSPSIVVLKSGEKLISFLQEAFEGGGEDKKGICLVMSYPYELSLINVEATESSPEMDLQVKYSKWCPYAQDVSYRIPYDSVMTIGTPDPGLAGAYIAKVEAQKQQESTATEAAEGDALAQQQADIAAAVGGAGIPSNAGVGANLDEVPATPAPVEVV